MVGRSIALFVVLRAVGLGQTGSIQGRVVDPTGAVIARAEVVLQGTGSPAAGINTESDRQGKFLLSGVAPGEYEVVISKPGFVPQTKTIAVTQCQTIDLASIALAIGAIPTCSRYTLEPPTITYERTKSRAARMDGTITRTDGAFLAGVAITLTPMYGNQKPTTRHSDEWGKFSFEGIAAGIYSLRTKLPGYADFIIDRIEIKPEQGTYVSALQMSECSSRRRCRPVRRVRVPEICL